MNVFANQSVLDTEIVSREGYQFRLSDNRWKLNKDVDIAVFGIDDLLNQELNSAFRQALAFYAQFTSPTHCKNLFERAKHYLISISGHVPFSVESLISYRSMLDPKTEWYLGALRGFIKQWHAIGYPGVDDAVIQLLGKWRIKGNEKGYAVQSMCPENGPLTDIEMAGIVEAVITAFVDGRLALLDTALMLTVAMTGRRPTQITALKIKDLIKQTNKEGINKFLINFPRAKQRYESWRTSFNKFPISEDLWLILQQQSVDVQRKFVKKSGGAVSSKLIPELPLFPNFEFYERKISLEEQLRTDILHAPTELMARVLDEAALVIKVASERTGRLIHLTPTRFRYTLGTNLAREGKREYVIAEALDHTDTQNAGVYVKNIPDIVKHINKAVARQLAPLAQAFQGVLVASERDAVRGNDPSSRITNGSKGVGTCGSYGFCGAIAPIACYTCNNFQPWLDGPHEEVLDELIKERDKVFEHTSDLKIASVNDRLILAVSDVVNRCKAQKEAAENV